MTHSNTTKLQALDLFINNTSCGVISKELGVGKATIERWKDKHDWMKKRVQNEVETMERQRKETQKRQLSFIHGIQGKFITALQAKNSKVKVSTRDFLESLKYERLVIGEPTEHTKQELEGSLTVSQVTPEQLGDWLSTPPEHLKEKAKASITPPLQEEGVSLRRLR